MKGTTLSGYRYPPQRTTLPRKVGECEIRTDQEPGESQEPTGSSFHKISKLNFKISKLNETWRPCWSLLEVYRIPYLTVRSEVRRKTRIAIKSTDTPVSTPRISKSWLGFFSRFTFLKKGSYRKLENKNSWRCGLLLWLVTQACWY